MATKYQAVPVKGAKPETFIVVGIDASKKDIETWIEQARKYPG